MKTLIKEEQKPFLKISMTKIGKSVTLSL